MRAGIRNPLVDGGKYRPGLRGSDRLAVPVVQVLDAGNATTLERLCEYARRLVEHRRRVMESTAERIHIVAVDDVCVPTRNKVNEILSQSATTYSIKRCS